MRKFLIPTSLVALLLPALAFAAASVYNDVSITGSAVSYSVNGITLNVSAGTLATTTVGATTFTVGLAPNSTVHIVAPNRNIMSLSDGASAYANVLCDDSGSNMTLSASASQATTTITVTPSTSLCSTSAGTAASGGGGGGGSSSVGVQRPSPVATAEASPATANANLTAEQRTTLIAQLTVQLNALLAQLAILKGGSSAPGFSRDLELGATGSDVKSLQQYLNNHGFDISASGAGSAGNETEKFGGLTKAALIKFQKASGITPVTGYFGPKTRNYIAAHP